jgi:hypothetical protein
MRSLLTAILVSTLAAGQAPPGEAEAPPESVTLPPGAASDLGLGPASSPGRASAAVRRAGALRAGVPAVDPNAPKGRYSGLAPAVQPSDTPGAVPSSDPVAPPLAAPPPRLEGLAPRRAWTRGWR